MIWVLLGLFGFCGVDGEGGGVDVVELVFGVGLGMGCGGADVGEDAEVSGDVALCGGGEDGLGCGEARRLVRYRFLRVCGELWEDLPNSFPFFLYFSCDVILVSLKRRSGEYG